MRIIPRAGHLEPDTHILLEREWIATGIAALLHRQCQKIHLNINASEAHNMSDERARSFRRAEFKRGAIAWGRRLKSLT